MCRRTVFFALVLTRIMLTTALPPVPVMVSTVYKPLTDVYDMAVDQQGNIICLLYTKCSVYKLIPLVNNIGNKNSITSSLLLAGSGVADGYGSTDGVGSIARFRYPWGMTIDADTNIAYIADSNNNLIRRMDLFGTNNVTTLAGSGAAGSFNGIGKLATFYGPIGIVLSPHASSSPLIALYVSESVGGLVRKIIVASAIVSTVASTTSGALLRFMCINKLGTMLYVTCSHSILAVNISTGTVETIAGSDAGAMDGVGPAAKFNFPNGIALNSDESALFIAEANNRAVRRVELQNKSVTTVAGTMMYAGSSDGSPSIAEFSSTYGARWYCNSSAGGCGVLVADIGNAAVRFVVVEEAPPPNKQPTHSVHTSFSISETTSISKKDTATTTTGTATTLGCGVTGSSSLSASREVSSSATWGVSRSNNSVSNSGTVLFLSASSFAHSRTLSLSVSRPSSLLATATAASSTMLSSWSSSATVSASTNSPSTSLLLETPTHSATSSTTAASTESESKFTTAAASPSSTITRATPAQCWSLSGMSMQPVLTSGLPDNIHSATPLMPTAVDKSHNNERSSITVITTSALSRRGMLQAQPFVANLTAEFHITGDDVRETSNNSGERSSGWRVANLGAYMLFLTTPGGSESEASQRVAITSSFVKIVVDVVSNNNTPSTFTTLRDALHFSIIMLHPPNTTSPPLEGSSSSSWLPASFGRFQAGEIEIHLVFECGPTVGETGGNNNESSSSDTMLLNLTSPRRDIVIVVPLPADVPNLASEVKSAGVVAQYASMLAGTATASSVGRLAAVRSLVLCSGDTFVNGILSSISIPTSRTCDAQKNADALATSRSTVIGNVILWLVGFIAMALAVFFYARGCLMSWGTAVAALGVPSPVLPLVVATIPSTVSSVFRLVQSNCAASDFAIASLGVLMCVLPIVVLGAVAYVVPRRLSLLTLATSRSTVIGNVILWLVGFIAMALAVFFYARGCLMSWGTAVAALGVPSPVLPLVVATIPSTVSSVFRLVQSNCAASDFAIASLGVVGLMCVSPIVVLGAVAYVVPRRLSLVPSTTLPRASDRVDKKKEKTIWQPPPWATGIFHRRVAWREREWRAHDSITNSLRRCATVVLLEYSVVWYACLDVIVLTLASVLGSQHTSVGRCMPGSFHQCARSLCDPVHCLHCGPPVDNALLISVLMFSWLLSSVSVSCQVGYIFASTIRNTSADLDAFNNLLIAAAACDLAVLGVSMLRAAVDLLEALRACHRHITTAVWLWQEQRTKNSLPATAILVDTTTSLLGDELLWLSVSHAAKERDNNTIDQLFLEEASSQFWRDDGTATILQLQEEAQENELGHHPSDVSLASWTPRLLEHADDDDARASPAFIP
ncbi:membrane-associated protein, putative [Bodo saltans]|uniref:Membrane-associated protein, putative n=1 Tax=Bodo saltans TaxID=75058 RepID=A0A0S4J6L1_BODSA|nr:membrane-associated protein, putative [Bodo saltans]|eukprot:CUG85945.1 membrane-associated protein, putative [Bodo saltans]